MYKIKNNFLVIGALSIFVLVLCLFVGCRKNHNYVYDFSLGNGLPNVKMNGDYYKVTLDYELKQNAVTDFYRTDGDEPYIVVYKFKWKNADGGNWKSMDEYFEHEANKSGVKTTKAAWEEAGFPDCKSYVKIEEFQGDLYMTTCYAVPNEDECIEVYYLDKTDEVTIKDAKVKFVVPRVNRPTDIPEAEKENGMLDNRMSTTPFFPSVGFYCNEISPKFNDGVYSSEFKEYLIKTENDTNIEQTTIGDYRALTGSRVDQIFGAVNFVIYEVGNHFVSVYYTASNEEMSANGKNIACSIDKA